MKENFDRTLAFVLKVEGATFTNYSDGPTKYGLTLDTMIKLGLDLDKDGEVTTADVMLVTPEVVEAAFRKIAWDAIGADNLPGGIDLVAADLAYNSGAGKYEQMEREGYTTTYDQLCMRRLNFYRYQRDHYPSQVKFWNGWVNRILDVWIEAMKCTV